MMRPSTPTLPRRKSAGRTYCARRIKLTLQAPHDLEYRQFTDRLLESYRQACRVQRDGRLSAAGLTKRVATLEEDVFALCAALGSLELPPLEKGPENDYRLLVNEGMRLMCDGQLLTF